MLLRDYQTAGVEFCESVLRGPRGSRAVLAGPTGCGKSYVEREVQRRLGAGCWLVTPRLEIARGILKKAGADASSAAALVRSCWEHRVVTPVRFLNALLRGDVPEVGQLVLDEGHHAPAGTWEKVQLLCGMPPAVVLTATPYRGTVHGTKAFLAEWGEPTWMVTLREAAARGDVSVPRCDVLPLVDDDTVEIAASGEFDVQQVVSAYSDRLSDLADASMRWHSGLWDRPTVFALPSAELAKRLAGEFQRRGAGAVAVVAATPDAERRGAWAALIARAAAVCQVAVMGEGVDLPVQRLVDARPMMSPVAWMQQFGRVTRPSPEPPEYWATNRNLSRHCYLLEGLVPPSAVAKSDEAFGAPSRRSGYRALGLEAVGRFRAAEVKLLDGCTASLYFLVDVSNSRVREIACFLHPSAPDPVWAERVHGTRADGSRDWGRWQRCTAPQELRGFQSAPPREPTEKMLAWWARSAAARGIDPKQRVTRKNFAALPLMMDLGLRVISS